MKKRLKNLIQSLKSLLGAKKDLKAVFIQNFIAGVAWGIGATLGLSLVITLFSTLLRKLGGLPLIGNFFAERVSGLGLNAC